MTEAISSKVELNKQRDYHPSTSSGQATTLAVTSYALIVVIAIPTFSVGRSNLTINRTKQRDCHVATLLAVTETLICKNKRATLDTWPFYILITVNLLFQKLNGFCGIVNFYLGNIYTIYNCRQIDVLLSIG